MSQMNVDPETVQQLASAVETALDPSSSLSMEIRQQAYLLCERFKESSPNCGPCGMVLAGKSFSPMVRHFGLQLFEHSIKFQWNNMSIEDKVFVKNSAMTLMANGTNALLVEPAHIKDALSRLIVEIIKREWPQQWPLMLQELEQLAALGDTQTELVLYILLRLAEDVVVFQNLPSQRRRELQQALTQNMSQIFDFLLELLNRYVHLYKTKREKNFDENVCKAACQISSVVLRTLSGYVEWIPVEYLVRHDALLLRMLCELLSETQLRQNAVEVLLLIVGRKGKHAERSPFVPFVFRADSMRAILRAVMETAHPTDERNFLFLKRLCQVLVALGGQLIVLWGSSEVDVQTPPENFQIFLSSLVEFSLHDSHVLNNLAMPLWSSFLGHNLISRDSYFLDVLPRLMKGLPSKLIRVGFPSANDHPSCTYSKMDFDSDDDFFEFFAKLRASVSQNIRLGTKFFPRELVEVASQWLIKLIGDLGNKSNDVQRWDACATLLDCVMSRINLSDEVLTQKAMDLLKSLLDVTSDDPVIFSSMLSCVSALFPCLTHGSCEAPLFLATLEKLFSAVVFNVGGQTKATRSRATKNLRRHACSSLVAICKKHADFMLPKFQVLFDYITNLDASGQLSQMEKVTLYEALILISNRFENFDKQSAFLSSVLEPIRRLWQSEEMLLAFEDNHPPHKFMTYVGLDQPASEPSADDICGINRSNIVLCLNMIRGVVTRTASVISKVSENLSLARDNGFVVDGLAEPSGAIFRNPATPHVIPLLKNVCLMLRNLNAMWTHAGMSRLHPDYTRALSLPEGEKKQLVGITTSPASVVDVSVHESFGAPKNPQERLQQFCLAIYDTGCQILGICGGSLGQQYYMLEGLPSFIDSNVFFDLELVPNYRIRLIVRYFLRPFFQNLPRGHPQVALTILRSFCPFLTRRLVVEWETINGRENSGDDNAPEVTNDEVVDEAVVRLLTREYLDLLLLICFEKTTARSEEANEGDAAMEGDDGVVDSAPAKSVDSPIGEIGKMVCQEEALCTSVLFLAFQALSWKDTATCGKCANLALPLVKEIVSRVTLPNEVVEKLFMDILKGLFENGQHDALQANLLTLGLQFYEAMAPTHQNSLVAALGKVPDVSERKIKEFNGKILPKDGKTPNDKRKRDIFKNLVESVIGKNVGQRFRSTMSINNLPPIIKKKPEKKPLLEVSPDEVGLIQLFTPQE